MFFQNRDRKFFELFQILKSSFDALDRLYRPDRPRVVEAVLDNSFQKAQFLSKTVFSQILGSQNVQKSTSRPALETFSIPNRIKKLCPTHW